MAKTLSFWTHWQWYWFRLFVPESSLHIIVSLASTLNSLLNVQILDFAPELDSTLGTENLNKGIQVELLEMVGGGSTFHDQHQHFGSARELEEEKEERKGLFQDQGLRRDGEEGSFLGSGTACCEVVGLCWWRRWWRLLRHHSSSWFCLGCRRI